MVAPARLTPGIIAIAWQKPMPSAVVIGMLSMLRKRGRGAMRSITRIAMPPTTRLTQTTQGENSTDLMKYVEDRAEHGSRQEGENHGQREAPRGGIARQPDQDLPQPAEGKGHDGQDRAELDHHIEDGVMKPQQIADQDQMAGGGNRQELGETLDRAEDQGRNRVVIHEIPRTKVPRRGLRERGGTGKSSSRAFPMTAS